MYHKVLLAYDGSREGRLALREGARLAQICGARVVLMAVVNPNAEYYAMADPSGVYLAPDWQQELRAILDEGAERLKRMGFNPEVRLETGSPEARIIAVASEVGADLVVVGHRKQGALSRWLLGSVTAALTDGLHCSLLAAQLEVPDEMLFGHAETSVQGGGAAQ
jgi:nucleotide-binding universal stress UspA family protein